MTAPGRVTAAQARRMRSAARFYAVQALFQMEAADAGLVPTISRWLASGSHRLESWWAQAPSTTPASQAGLLHGDFDVLVALEDPAIASGKFELARQHTHRLAGGAAFAGRAIDEILAAAEPVVAEQCVQRGRAAPGQVREELALHLPRQIRARHWRR